MLNHLKIFILPSLIFTLIGCAASSHIIVGNIRTPISPQLVKLYTKPPNSYEEVAIIDASSKNSWSITDQGKMEVAIKLLKEEAAKLGANGVLMQGTGNLSGGSLSIGTARSYGNFTYGYGTTAPASHKAARGIAIYVKHNQ